MNVTFFGGYDRGYPRNAVLRRGLSLAGASVSECRVRPGHKFWLRYPLLASAWPKSAGRGGRGFIFVPEFCQKDVPLARLLGWLGSRRVIFDPLASRFETKIVDWGWRSTSSLSAWWNRRIDGAAFRLADLVLADTAAHRDYYARFSGIPEEKFIVVPVGFDDRVFTREWARTGLAARAAAGTSPPFTVVFFGSFLPLHGVEVIIEAARLVQEKDPGVRFLMIGGGRTLPTVKRRAAELGLANIRFERWQGQEALAATVALQADLCLGIFGRTEKAARVVPHKVFQSLSLGKAVVTARTPAAEEFFRHEKDIYLCESGAPPSLAAAVLELKANPGLRAAIARRGFDLAWEKFRPAALGASLRDILETKWGQAPPGDRYRPGTVPADGI